jgi:N-formylglutamate amidohydrolase
MLTSFERLGPVCPATPLLISVPHAARLHPPAMAGRTRLSTVQLQNLEDRYADLLCAAAVEDGHSAIIASCARAWIDLNRGEDELDSSMVAGHPHHGLPSRTSAKVRGGLGLIPRRIAQGGDIWRGPLTRDDVSARIETIHRPYHRALAEGLTERVAIFGWALLLDLHSMPSLPGIQPPHIVFGDLYGRSASPHLVEAALTEAQEAGFRAARNAPYAGGMILERHSAPHRGIHALQVEIDRRLYLDDRLAEPGPGLATMTQWVRRLANRLTQRCESISHSIAAE